MVQFIVSAELAFNPSEESQVRADLSVKGKVTDGVNSYSTEYTLVSAIKASKVDSVHTWVNTFALTFASAIPSGTYSASWSIDLNGDQSLLGRCKFHTGSIIVAPV